MNDGQQEYSLTEYEQLYSVTRAIADVFATDLPLAATFKKVLQILADWIQVDGAAVWERDSLHQELFLLCSLSLRAPEAEEMWLPIGTSRESGIAGHVASSGIPIVYANYNPDTESDQIDTRYRNMRPGVPIRSIAAFPLFAQGNIVGVLQLMNDKSTEFPKTAVNMLTEIGRHWGDVIEGRKRREERDGFESLDRAFYRAFNKCWKEAEDTGIPMPSERSFFSCISNALGRYFDADICLLGEYMLRDMSVRALGQPYCRERTRKIESAQPIEHSPILKHVLESRSSLRVRDLHDPGELSRRELQDLISADARSPSTGATRKRVALMATPILTKGGRPLGFIHLEADGRRSQFTEVSQRILEESARRLSDSLREWRLNGDLLALTKQVRLANPLDNQMQSMQRILDKARQILDADWLYVMEYMAEHRALVAVAASGRDVGEIPDLDLGEESEEKAATGVNVHVFKTGRAYLASDVQKDPLYASFVRGPQAGSEMCVPMQIGENGEEGKQVAGTICASSALPDVFDYSKVTHLSALSASLALLLMSWKTLSDLDNAQMQFDLATTRKHLFDIASIAVHDFHTWLRSFSKRLEASLKGRPDPASTRSTLTGALTSAWDWSEKLQVIKDAIGGGGMPMPRVFQLKDVIKQAVNSVSGIMMDDKPLNIIKADLPDVKVKADRIQVRLVIENLLKNAWQQSYKGQRHDRATVMHVWITAGNIDNSVFVSIRDEGPGFSAEYLLDDLPDAPLRSERGAGLGLWISRRLMKVNGGKLRIENNVDGRKGATVTVFLPSA